MMRICAATLLAVTAVLLAGAGGAAPAAGDGDTLQIHSGGRTYPALLARPAASGRHPAVILLHSINGFEEGYATLTRQFAAEGFVVLALQWQVHERTPPDAVVEQLLRDGITYLRTRPEVDGDRIGLTGFCIGGRYTMLMLPLVSDFKSGVSWYGFPYAGGSATQPQKPAELIGRLQAPMLILHGTADRPSPIADIYRYAAELDAAGKYFELKVYQGQPHGFMLRSGALSDAPAAQDAFREMVAFFRRTL